MSINETEFQRESTIPLPFGKRLLDQAVTSRLKGVGVYKVISVTVAHLTFVVLYFSLSSERVTELTPRALDIGVKTVTSAGDKILIPKLVMEYKSQTGFEKWAKIKISPIKILSFVGDKKIPPGAEAKAVLLTGATNGLIKARLVQNLTVDGETLLDSGVILMGQGHSTEERLFIDFKKAVFKDGKFISIAAQAYDASDLILGLKGERVGDLGLKLAASSGLNFLSGMAVGMETPTYNQYGMPVTPNVGTAALNGVSKAASDQASMYMEQIKNRPPIIEVKRGTVFTVTFDGGEQ